MAKYAKITKTGIEIPTVPELLDIVEVELKKQDSFGENIDFSDQDPLKQFIYPIILIARDLYEFGQDVFYAGYPEYAEGNSLSYIMPYQGTRRKQAAKARHIIRFTGSSGTKIQKGYIVATENLINFITIAEGSIQSNGYIDIEVEAERPGSNGNAPEGTINNIINPIIGLTSITNVKQTKEGQDKETDIAARQRFKESSKGGTGSSIDAIRVRLLEVTGVKSALVKENVEDIEVDGIPPHSLYVLVQGGNDEDIAKAIMEKKAGGIKTFGEEEIVLEDSQGIPHKIYFNRPNTHNVYVRVVIAKLPGYPADGDELIKESVEEYINRLNIGEDVIIYKIISTVSNLKLAGIDDIKIELSTDGINYTASNIIIGAEKIAITDIGKVVIQ